MRRLSTTTSLPWMLLLLQICVGLRVTQGADMTPEQRSFFENKIRPVLVKQCYECHSQGAKKLGGKLLLDAPSEMISGGESGPSMIPGKPDESLIIQALRYDGLEMPPKKRLPDSVVSDFVTWVKMGAPDPRVSVAATVQKNNAPPKEALWSYQPVTAPAVPTVTDNSWPETTIDRFILARLGQAKLKPAADAEAAVLIRRLYVDLIGLPPTLEQTSAFVANPGSLEKVVDSLLSSQHFGERWGRYWLDVARYAESNGNDGLSRNPSFPHAWRYRDYVIDSFNKDVPYDRFITEQIAGDLLPTASDSKRDRHLIATSFLALGAKPAKAMNENFEMDVVADQISVIGNGIMGLSVGCARCHDHKTDPIPTRDYYALAGIFKSSETLWGAAALEGLTAPQTALHELKTSSKTGARAEVQPILLAHTPRRAQGKPAFKYAPGAALSMGIREGKAATDCKINIDGDSKKLGVPVPRGFVTACGEAGSDLQIDAKQSGRLQLARWLVSSKHPQTSRVIVNRIWQHLFGEGIVRTPDDFGITGARPSHPELLDHLATTFMADHWSIKRLIRSIVLSRTYRLTSQSGSSSDEKLISLFGRHQRRRMDAESIRDTMLQASGDLDRRPATGSLIQGQDVLINELPPLHQPVQHRSIYLLMLRNSMPPELTPFNLPDALGVAGKRETSSLTTQSLYLLNNAFLIRQSERFATRLQSINNEQDRLKKAYEMAFGRTPTGSEMQKAADFIREVDSMLVSTGDSKAKPSFDAWAAFCQALLASNELRYVD